MPQIESTAPTSYFVDSTFPLSNEIVKGNNDDSWTISWKRPKELIENPVLYVNGTKAADVVQGGLGDCWFLSACIAVAHSDLLWKVIPENQVLYGAGYSGMVSFNFWKLGEWETIAIDDRLPVNEDNQLVYSHSKDPNEFWVPLLEKAFAKFHGGYSNLAEGQRMEGLISLTGFIVQNVDNADFTEDEMFQLLDVEMKRKSLVTCCARENYHKGLSGDHTYTVTGAWRLRTLSGSHVYLVRIRNPWGATPDSEWTGAWHDGDRRWERIDEQSKAEIQFQAAEDGEFWMNVKDFIDYFQEVTLAMETPLIGGKPMEHIENLHVLQGAWVKDVSAGGSQSDMALFATNPQFSLVITGTDDSDYCPVVLEIIQEHDRKKYKSMEDIGIFIYEADAANRRLSARQLESRPEWGEASQHEAASAVVEAALLPPGAYVLIASTYEVQRQRRFVLRVYSSRRVMLRAL